LIYYIALPL